MCNIFEAQAEFAELTYKLLIYYLMEFSASGSAALSCQNILNSVQHTGLDVDL